jgi:malto-oligosyltrehalose trehalohydrolase
VLENDDNATRYLRRHGGAAPIYDAQWNDDFHHAAHVLLTGESAGYYVDYVDQPIAHLGRALTQGFSYQGESSRHRGGRKRGEPSAMLPPAAFVNFLQNHDQIGNRALGERLNTLVNADALRAFHALLLLAPGIPLLFMGEEWGSKIPFYYFCDFEGELAKAVVEGRRREFATFPEFADPSAQARIPDPNDYQTYVSSKLDWPNAESVEGRTWLDHIRSLLRLRTREIMPRLGRLAGQSGSVRILGASGLHAQWLLGDGCALNVVAQLGSETGYGFKAPDGELIWASGPNVGPALIGGSMPAWSVAWYLRRAA